MKKIFIFGDRLGIKNFRSFDEEGIYLHPLSKINLFIGKNNCGKSNVLKFLRIVSGLNGAWGSFPSSSENVHIGSIGHTAIFFKYTHAELGWPDTYTSRYKDGSTSKQPLNRALVDPVSVEYEFKNNQLRIVGWRKQGEDDSGRYIYYDENDVSQSIITHLGIITASYGDQWKQIEAHYRDLFVESLKAFLTKVIYIPDFREITSSKTQQPTAFTSNISGQNIIEEMHKMKNPDLHEEESYKTFKHIEDTVKFLLDSRELSIEIPHTKDKMILDMNGNRLALENLGTGIHEIVLLCSAIILHPESIVCIEEPEIHLHPGLQRRFIRFLQQTKNQYFLSTHSNVFLDETNIDLSIFHLQYDSKKSVVARRQTGAAIRAIIEDLGYKASDLLQSNGIIWVEGPSDRIYLNKWLKLTGSEFLEGIHYSIMFYGGKLLSHLSFADAKEELIQLLRLNRNAYVVIDRDSVKDVINTTKKRISDEIGEANCWITKGKEIENYLSKETINNWLATKNDNGRIKTILPNQKFDALVKKAAPTLLYGRRKVPYSSEIANYIRTTDLNRLDLKEKLNNIMEGIDRWNNDAREE